MHCVSTALPLILDPMVLISMPTGHIPLFDFSMFRAPRQPAFMHLMHKCHYIAFKIDRWTEQPTCTASILSRDGKYQSITLQLVAIAKATTQMKCPIDDRGEKIYRALTLIRSRCFLENTIPSSVSLTKRRATCAPLGPHMRSAVRYQCPPAQQCPPFCWSCFRSCSFMSAFWFTRARGLWEGIPLLCTLRPSPASWFTSTAVVLTMSSKSKVVR